MKRRERGGGWWKISVEGPFNKMYDSAQFSLKSPHNRLVGPHVRADLQKSAPGVICII